MNLFDCKAIHINKIYSVKKYSGFAKPLSPKEYGIFFKTYKIVIYLSGIQKRLMQKAHEYIMENYRNPDFDYKVLCHASALEYAYFSELFKKTFKMSPVRFVTKMRIDYAQKTARHKPSVHSRNCRNARFFQHVLLFERIQKTDRIFTLAIPY